MKNVLKILIAFFVIVCYGQIDIKDTSGWAVYVNDTLYSNHRNMANALESQMNVLHDNPGASVQILPTGKVTATFSKDFFQATGTELVQYHRDTLIKVGVVISKTGATDFSGWYHVRNFYDRYGDKEYITDCEALLEQPARYVMDSVSYVDSTKATRKYFFTKHWLFSKREAMTPDSLKNNLVPFDDWCCYPGEAVVKVNGKDIPVRRHTQTFTKKYYQVRAKDTVFGTIDTLSIYGNFYMKD